MTDVARRIALVCLGSFISTLAYALTVRADLGLGPLYAVQDGVARHLHITLGHSVMLTGVALVMVAAAFRVWPGPGTVALPFMGGALLDWMLPHMPHMHALVVRVLVVVAASWAMSLGGALIISASIGVAALDGVMIGLQRRFGFSLRSVRLGMEAAMLVGGWLLGGAVGVGTVITGALIGPGLHFWLQRVDRRHADEIHVTV